jgi:hypothetical protein
MTFCEGKSYMYISNAVQNYDCRMYVARTIDEVVTFIKFRMHVV